jgi:hypothetical protein
MKLEAVVLAAMLIGCGDTKGGGLPDAPVVGSDSGESFFDASPDSRPPDSRPPMAYTINFDDVPTDTTITTQYATATFSTPVATRVNRTSNAGGLDYGQSMPNFLCTANAPNAAVDCTSDTIVDFPMPVRGLSFHAIQANNTGTVASIKVYVSGALAGTLDLIGTGQAMAPVVIVDLSQYSNVTRIELTALNDGGGIGWDDFAFTVP